MFCVSVVLTLPFAQCVCSTLCVSFLFYRPGQVDCGPVLKSQFVSVRRARLRAAGPFVSGHFFCRGGASWAFSMGIPGELIQVFGDWRSDAYKCYLDISVPLKLQVSEGMIAHLLACLACSDIGCLAGLAGRVVVIVLSLRLSLVGGFLNNKASLCAKQSVSLRLLFVVFSLRRKLFCF